MISARRSFFAVLVFSFALAGLEASAEPTAEELLEASTFVRQLADDTIASLEKTETGAIADRERIENLLEQGFEVKYIGQIILGRHWRKASKDQRDEYNLLFQEFVLDVIMQRLSIFTSEELEITGQAPAGKRDIFVNSRVIRDRGTIAVDWRVRKIGDVYRIVDIKIAGVSMVITYREDFGAVVQSKGIGGLLDSLREKTIETEPLNTEAA